MQLASDHRDLERSFEKLKSYLNEAEKLKNIGGIISARAAYYTLEDAINNHIKECTLPEPVDAANPDDLKDINI